MNNTIFYKPAEGWVGDVIPYCEGEEFHLFYLHERRESPREGMSWRLVTTKDFVHYEDRGDRLVHGTAQDPDFNAYTGSVVKDHDGRHHLFYTGHNPRHCGDNGLPLQRVMHAVSEDGMATWHKIPADIFGAPVGYEQSDWRDPFVFWDEESKIWRLVLAARHTSGADRRRGVVAQCVSKDLSRWEIAEPLWDPGRYITQECPDVFFWNGWWYLVYSEFSDAFATRYRMSRSLEGPWVAPSSGKDSVDGRAFYAAKTAQRDGRRLFFGWIPSRIGESDEGAWQWAGTMSVSEGTQNADGSLSFRIPHEVKSAFSDLMWNDVGNHAVGRSDGYDAKMFDLDVPRCALLHGTFEIGEDRADAGVIVKASKDGDLGHIIRFEPKRSRMVVDRWPRPRTGGEQWQISGDVPFAVELERPCDLPVGRHEFDIIIEDDICVVNLDQDVMLSTRLETSWGSSFGVFSNDGVTRFSDFAVLTRNTEETK
ncbi:family 43 glycosylhydrolase [Bifidobacterium amazonense]|uniref:beta-fructofuranosidase n=3 Tax=Bifidobacterium TaxID=1678 RepID=A0ABS9VUF8_9BIFI|nr:MULTISPECIES: glycoside hydrolase family 32 protein [Bifidobacterium]MBT1173309.1 family 43 glycosylhydrolase [Bifidobacterium santillanense]MBT1174101.1 family 43 glycosylhydrolase [Bifidobacterium colobi]MCH9275731.1 family 43 glycosylhydrolase [Bifidobacterium amazonense]